MKKRLLISIMTALALLLPACANSASTKTGTGNSLYQDGQYVQEYISMPDNETSLRCIKKMENDTIRAVGRFGIYESDDIGKTWKDVPYESPHLKEAAFLHYSADETPVYNIDIACMSLSPQGAVFLEYTKSDYLDLDPDDYPRDADGGLIEPDDLDTNMEHHRVLIYPDGSEQTITQESELSYDSAVFSQDSQTLVAYDTELLHVIDTASGMIRYTIPTDFIDDYTIYKDLLITHTGLDISTYKLESGRITDNLPALDEYFTSELPSSCLLIPDESNDTLYMYTNGEGIYKIKEDSAIAELMLDGSRYSLADDTFDFHQILLLEEDSFLASFNKTGKEGTLLYYSYSENAAAIITELTVYSLYENASVQQGIAGFQEEHPEYSIRYTYGMDAGEMPLTDAIKALNTEILSGNGPDVLIMDGIPVDAYIEKDALVDLSDIIATSDSSYFENIINTYKYGDSIYAIPTQFQVLVLLGSSEHLDQITDLNSLASFVAHARQNDSNGDLTYIAGSLNSLTSYMLQSSGNALLNDNHTIDEAKLKQFVSNVKTIYDHNELISESEPDFEAAPEEPLAYPSWSYFTEDLSLHETAYGKLNKNILSSGTLGSLESLYNAFTILDNMDYSCRTLPGMDENIYIPMHTYAVSGKSEHTEAAKELISYMLSDDMQIQMNGSMMLDGLPVNATAYTRMYTQILSDVENGQTPLSLQENDFLTESYGIDVDLGNEQFELVEFDACYGTKQGYEDMKDLFHSLQTPALQNSIIVDAILGQLNDHLAGDITVDEAVQNIIKKVNIYLAE